MSKKLTYEYVKSKFEEEGWELLSDIYVNNHTRMKCSCCNGHVQFKKLSAIQNGQKCVYCIGKKYTLEKVLEIFESKGLESLFKEYINNRTPLKYICSNGCKHQIRLDDLLKGRSLCAKNSTKTIEEVKEIIEARGEKLVSLKYINTKSKIKIECGKGHIYTTTFGNYQNTRGCRTCQYLLLSKKFSKNEEEVKEILLQYNCTLISEFINTKTKFIYICALGHINTKTLDEFRRVKYKCTQCYTINNIGKNHPNWQGGLSLQNYCDAWQDKEYKKDIRKRDNNICQNPYCYKNDKRLHIHHMDYDKKNCRPNNLITICGSCNSRANYSRNWHKEWYQILMNKKYNYVYT